MLIPPSPAPKRKYLLTTNTDKCTPAGGNSRPKDATAVEHRHEPPVRRPRADRDGAIINTNGVLRGERRVRVVRDFINDSRQRLVAYLIEMPQINGEVARRQRRAHKPVPSASWADFDVELVSTLDRVRHVPSVAGVEDGGGMRLEIDHNISRFGVGSVLWRGSILNLLGVEGTNTRQSIIYLRTGDLGHKAVRPNFRQPRGGRHKSTPG